MRAIPLWYANPAAARPPVHALVVGTSSYPYRPFGLGDLPGAAGSAYGFACWLRDHLRPEHGELASIRLLLAPIDGDRSFPDHPAIVAPTRDAVLAALGEWRDDCHGPSGVPILALAGHGLQVADGEGVVLVHDAGRQTADPLAEAIDLTAIRRGLSGPGAPPSQWFFVDMCRTPGSQLETYGGDVVGGIRLRPGGRPQPRHSPVFYSSLPGQASWQSAEGTIFYRALEACLRLDALQPDDDANWRVTAETLTQAMARRVPAIARTLNVEQAASTGGFSDGRAVFTTADPPQVPFTVAMELGGGTPLQDGHVTAMPSCGAALVDTDSKDVIMARRPLPVVRVPVRGGLWRLDVTFDPSEDAPYADAEGIPVIVYPPAGSKTVTLRSREPGQQ